ncbi:predicted protein [Naegleria gruberi]|uniref:Predicted protein n=1 Tax=Naegleria gruberi TaxID=5762 RepID=D2V2Y7_NAEGR|nr:uncharacterized protein NAEGRDRAFT_63162 [Naegleria gruberi]EFC48533.1 predicted protein [Naegleria gruberi]|eukprot:XP_002681277.1 predicted protein [Naegleria gruberi strain NEG-M]
MSQDQTPESTTTDNTLADPKLSISKLINNLTENCSNDEIDNISERIESSPLQNHDQSELLCSLGEVLYLLQRDDEKAMMFIEKSIQKNDQNAKAYFYKGMLAVFIPGREDDDIIALEKAIEIKSDIGFYWFELGRAFIRKKMDEKALECLKKYVELDREDAIKKQVTSTLYNLGMRWFLEKNYEKALESFEIADGLSLDPDLQLKGKIVQTYEKLGKKTERDETIQELYKLYRNKSLENQIRFCRDQFTLDSYENHTNVTVFVYEFFELIGDMALKYLFQVSTEKSILCKISMGSYTFTNQFHMEMNSASQPDERVYHLDGYYPGMHKTFGFYSGTTEKPNITYEELKQKVLDILEGNSTAISSSTTPNQ